MTLTFNVSSVPSFKGLKGSRLLKQDEHLPYVPKGSGRTLPFLPIDVGGLEFMVGTAKLQWGMNFLFYIISQVANCFSNPVSTFFGCIHHSCCLISVHY